MFIKNGIDAGGIMASELGRIIRNGILSENALLCSLLGLCPALAVVTNLENGLAMGLTLLFVLTSSGLFVSIIKKVIPDQVRIPVFLVIIAFFTTVADLLMRAYLPHLSGALGIYIPIIAVNCIITTRLDLFASKNPPLNAAADGLGMGLGFALVLIVIGLAREVLGSGRIAIGGQTILTLFVDPIGMVALPPGGFIIFGFFLAFVSWLRKRHLGVQAGR